MPKKQQHRLPSDDTLHGAGGAPSALRTLLWTGAAVGAAALANAVIFYKTPPLTSKLSGGEVRYFPTPEGDVFYKKAGDGPPLLLVHGIGAGASSFEWRNVWEPLAEQHTVYALDLARLRQERQAAARVHGCDLYRASVGVRQAGDGCRRRPRRGGRDRHLAVGRPM
jgi:hypothetical protein